MLLQQPLDVCVFLMLLRNHLPRIFRAAADLFMQQIVAHAGEEIHLNISYACLSQGGFRPLNALAAFLTVMSLVI